MQPAPADPLDRYMGLGWTVVYSAIEFAIVFGIALLGQYRFG